MAFGGNKPAQTFTFRVCQRLDGASRIDGLTRSDSRAARFDVLRKRRLNYGRTLENEFFGRADGDVASVRSNSCPTAPT